MPKTNQQLKNPSSSNAAFLVTFFNSYIIASPFVNQAFCLVLCFFFFFFFFVFWGGFFLIFFCKYFGFSYFIRVFSEIKCIRIGIFY